MIKTNLAVHAKKNDYQQASMRYLLLTQPKNAIELLFID